MVLNDDMANRLEPIEDLVGRLFVNREFELELLWKWVNDIPSRRSGSRALIGRRRTGKTAILVKLFNRLFYEQEAVLPVYISFARFLHWERPLTMQEVGDHYLASYLLCFLAFRYRQPERLWTEPKIWHLQQIAPQFNDPIVNDLLEKFVLASAETRIGDPPAQLAINTPRYTGGLYKLPTVVMVDEFQVLTTVHDSKQGISHDLTDSFQWAFDTKWAPMLVSGSAVNLLVTRALGGMLSGRYKSRYIGALSRDASYELMNRLGQDQNICLTTEFIEAVWQFTGGYPYSIHSLLTTDHPARELFPALDALEAVILYELGDQAGALRGHYDEEFLKYTELLNEGQTTKKVMFWAVKYPELQIDADYIAQALELTIDEVQQALQKLHQAEIVSKTGWTLYEGPSDPMLRRYIEAHYQREIEKLMPAEATKDWRKEYRSLLGRMSNFVGHIAEGHVYALMSAFDDRTVKGEIFCQANQAVTLPTFTRVQRRSGIIKAGKMIEMDLVGEKTLNDGPSQAAWLVQVKNTEDAIGEKEISYFVEQTNKIIAEKQYAQITRWYVSKAGYTVKAQKMLIQTNILHSDLDKFNALSELFGMPSLEKSIAND